MSESTHTPNDYRTLAGDLFLTNPKQGPAHIAKTAAYQRRSEGHSIVGTLCGERVEGHVVRLGKAIKLLGHRNVQTTKVEGWLLCVPCRDAATRGSLP